MLNLIVFAIVGLSIAVADCNGQVKTNSQEGTAFRSKTNSNEKMPQENQDHDPASQLSPFVRRTFQDKSGNLWFGTNGDGVIRYDGDALEYFSTNEGFGGVAVKGIVQDKEGNIWFGTEGGITKYDGESFTNFTEKDGLATSAIQCTFEDREGRLWLGGWMGLFRYDGKSILSVGKKGPWH